MRSTSFVVRGHLLKGEGLIVLQNAVIALKPVV